MAEQSKFAGALGRLKQPAARGPNHHVSTALRFQPQYQLFEPTSSFKAKCADMGEAYQRTGPKQVAIDTHRKSLAKHPNDETVKQKLEESETNNDNDTGK